jgi:hypothetical protein
MGIEDKLNFDQMRVTPKNVHGLGLDKDYSEVVARASSGPVPLIVVKQRNNHFRVHIKDDGIVTGAGSGGRGRGHQNFESDLRRNIRQLGHDFPRRNESQKQFERRMQKKSQETTEVAQETPEVKDES